MLIKKVSFMITAAFILTLGFTGCFLSLDDSSLGLNSSTPTYSSGDTDNINPVVNSVSTPEAASATNGDWRIYIYFSEIMDSSTINTTNIYLRDVNSAAAPSLITGHTVIYDAGQKRAVLEWNSTEDDLELVVTSSVTDTSGNGLAGDSGSFASFLDESTAAAYRQAVDPYGTSAFAPNYTPARITISQGGGTTSVTVTVTFSQNDIDAATIAETDFSLSSGTIASATYTENTNASGGITSITFDCTGLAENTEYTVTFTPPSGLSTTEDYPDGATTLNKTVLFDTYGNSGTVKRRSDYILVFKTGSSTLTPPTYTGAVDLSGTSGNMVQVNFSEAMDSTTVLDTDNYVAYGVSSNELQVDISPVYTAGTGITGVILSTMAYTQGSMYKIVLKSGLLSEAGEPFDGNGDGIMSGDNDYDNNGVIDDWKTLNYGTDY